MKKQTNQNFGLVPLESIEPRFINARLSTFIISKIDGDTNAPLEGVIFEITTLEGERIRNPFNGSFEFITDNSGLVRLPELPPGAYVATEIQALPGYQLAQPQVFNIGHDQDLIITIRNFRYPDYTIRKIDGDTEQPLQGVHFEIAPYFGGGRTGERIRNPHDGGFVFITDQAGLIRIPNLPHGTYVVTETRALPGYILAAPVIFNVDNNENRNNVVGVFYTDNMGLIDLSAILVQDRYTIRLTRPAPGYFADDMPRTIEFVAGTVTEIVWEAIPEAGQLQILKFSGDDNQLNALPAGTPLQGAIFEVFDYRTGNLVDRIMSNERGMAVSRPLPLGRYFAIEVTAPQFYMLNPSEIHFTIEFATQIVRVEFPNFSANIGVNIDITGSREVMPGHTEIAYDVRNIRNESTVPLADFFWRYIVPADAVRIDRLVTGTFNVSLRYAIRGTTNLGNDFVIADNLLTTRNNTVELGAVHLGLAGDEYLAEIIIMFGQVPAGFTSVLNPRIYVDILSENHPMWPALLPDGMMFAHKVDVGGRHFSEWVISNDTVATGVFNPQRIPRSGF